MAERENYKLKKKPVTRRAKIKRLTYTIASCAVLLAGVGFIAYGIISNLRDSAGSEKKLEPLELAATLTQLDSGISVLVPDSLTALPLEGYTDSCSYISTNTTEGVPGAIYFVLETEVPKEDEDKALSVDILPRSIEEDIISVCKTLMRGGSVSPAYQYDYIGVNGKNLVSMNGEIWMVAATERKIYTFPEGVELDPETGEPKGTKPNGTRWTMADAEVSIAGQPVNASCDVKIMTSRFENKYITVVAMWNTALFSVSEDGLQGLVTQASLSVGKE